MMNYRYSIIILVTVFLTLIPLTGCVVEERKGKSDMVLDKIIPFEVLIKDSNKTAWVSKENNLQQMYLVLTEKNEMNSYLNIDSDDPVSSPFPPKELKKVDFNNEIALFLTRGEKASGPFSLDVISIQKGEKKVFVQVKMGDPRDVAYDAVQYRITLLKVSKENLPEGKINVIFIDQNKEVLHEESIVN
jgi:hypothetical protein